MHTKTSFLIVLFLSLVFSANALGQTYTIPYPAEHAEPEFRIENLSADLYSDDTVLLIKGTVKNMGHKSVKGYVIVFLRDENNDQIGSVETDVNKRGSFGSGDSGKFEVAADIQSITGIKNVSIEFVEIR
ncbi:MAG: hypothetical protein KAJ60_05900 [Desulfobulbaceae bacterium]|nr:hypothetical protein [Desulfobulbaceae bacterium]MCK5340586.1 hypothetical protein [Desulfobulbaceae bacterium]